LLKVALKHQNQIKSIYKNRYPEKTTDLPHVTDDKLEIYKAGREPTPHW
jgi:hypothetical protein